MEDSQDLNEQSVSQFNCKFAEKSCGKTTQNHTKRNIVKNKFFFFPQTYSLVDFGILFQDHKIYAVMGNLCCSYLMISCFEVSLDCLLVKPLVERLGH